MGPATGVFDSLYRPARSIGINIRDTNNAPFLCKVESGSAPNAAATTSNEHTLVFEAHCLPLLINSVLLFPVDNAA